jgi:predicted PurR-regulated permease PerM
MARTTSELEGRHADDERSEEPPSLRHAEVEGKEQEAEARSLGRPGRPINQRNPFFIGLTGALGVAVAWVAFRTISDAGQVLTLIALALFIAIGLDPAVTFFTRHRLPRGLAVTIVVLILLAVVVAFVIAAVGPISREVQQLTVSVPRYERQIRTGHGWLGHLAQRFHLTSYLKSGKVSKVLTPSTVVGGVLGAGKLLLSAFTSITVVTVLTIYFLITLPSIRRLWLRLFPQSRRTRVGALSDEVTSRVGGFMLGNLATSVISGALTAGWMAIFGLPYPILLGLLVAFLDLIPVVGSTVGGIIVSLVALTAGLPIAIATAGFYVFYRLFEDYLLMPRVMRHTVSISAGLTIIATLIGGVLLGLIGALLAIPVAAGIHLLLDEVAFPSLDGR